MRLSSLLLITLGAHVSFAQTADTAKRASGTRVNGVVFDSLAGMPLSSALVQLVGMPPLAHIGNTIRADSLGRFMFDEVADGRYTLGFYHPVLDSVGVAGTLREVYVAGHALRADLAVPSPSSVRSAVCGLRSAADSAGVVVGTVRDAVTTEPLSGVSVTGEWLELSLGKNGMTRRVPHLTATTGDNGWFAICNVPRGASIFVLAKRGADSTDAVEIDVPANGFVRRELYLGQARTVVAALDSIPRLDSVVLTPKRVRSGDARISGVVRRVDNGEPLAGAQVGIFEGPQTRTNSRGEWSLTDVPTGTRALEVRAVSYYPERRAINVYTGAPSIGIAMRTLKAVLDTIRVTAARGSRDLLEFEQRRRSGIGKYLTSQDIMRLQPNEVTDVFRTIPGVRIEFDTDGQRHIYVRGNVSSPTGSSWCEASIFLNGSFLRVGSSEELEGWLRPKDIKALEVYSGPGTPLQFQSLDVLHGDLGGASCGSVVIWTR